MSTQFDLDFDKMQRRGLTILKNCDEMYAKLSADCDSFDEFCCRSGMTITEAIKAETIINSIDSTIRKVRELQDAIVAQLCPTHYEDFSHNCVVSEYYDERARAWQHDPNNW